MICSSCGARASDESRFCPSCGSPLNPSEAPTFPRADSSSLPSRVAASPTPAALDAHARYVPGTTLVGRYRMVALLGKGGMGDVYRAEDLKLGQTVALKFLPPRLANDPSARERFHREVRLARQVSHPNVCRVFDIGEADGRDFITMEYIDGEDLAALLRRIGRLPPDKALEIARQMCAGLAAAHDHGIIHRDMKPANIMLDGRGRVRITDFGLAAAAAELQGEEATAGTPAYMSPEQFEGREVTLKSDLYALGLVLYEIFTGKQAFDAPTYAEMLRLREKSTPSFPSHLEKDIDPLVQRLILRCLEKEPAKRPASALQVAAALPGGDPLAAALAAGETPSPDMVAAAGGTGALSPARAWALLASVVVVLAAVVAILPHTLFLDLLPAGKSPAALTERAQEIAREHGHAEAPADSAHWYQIVDANAYWSYLSKVPAPARYRDLGAEYPSPLEFFYRQSSRPLDTKIPWHVNSQNPPPFYAGDLTIGLDLQGRLDYFSAIPAPQNAEPSGNKPVDWSSFLHDAGLDPAKAHPIQAGWYPDVATDRQFAWHVERNGESVRVHAGSFHDTPVFFQVQAPWARQARTVEVSPGFRLASWTFLLLAVPTFVFCLFLARRNLRLGRGDKKGALFVATFLFGVDFVSWALGSHYISDPSWMTAWWMITLGLSAGLGLQLWVYYVALEPYVRRSKPELLISWSRLLEGRFRDPLVGRDVLVGILFGVAMLSVGALGQSLPYWSAVKGLTPLLAPTALRSVGVFAGSLIGISVSNALLNPVGALAVFVVLWKLTRSKTLSIVFVGLGFAAMGISGRNAWVELLFASVTAALFVLCLLRVGLLGAVFAQFVYSALVSAPVTLDFSRWYAGWGLGAVLVVLALALYGFYTSLGSRPLLGAAFEE